MRFGSIVTSSVLGAWLAPSIALATEPDQVTMDLDQFLRMYEETKNRPEKPAPAPRDWALSSAHYKGEVILDNGEPVSAQFSARMHVEVLKDKDWVKVPLLPVTVALQSAKLSAQDASIVLEGGFYTLVTQKRGSFDVELLFAAEVQKLGGLDGIAFELVPSGATDVVFAVPSSDALDFTVANARLKQDHTDAGKRVVEATLPATGAMSIQWQRELPTEQAQEPRIYAQVYTLVGIGDGVLQATATIDHTILFSGVDTLRVQIPEGMTLLDVRGAGIRDWTLGSDQTVAVLLNDAAEGAYTLTLDLEKVIGEGSLEVQAPVITPVGVERSKGWVGVEARGNLELSSGSIHDATPVDVRTLPAAILGITSNPVLLGYKYLGNKAQIPLQVSQHADVDVLVTLADQARATTMFTADGRRLTSVQYEVRNNRTQFLRAKLPEGAELWSASVAGRAVQPAKAGDGRILVPLIRSQQAGGALAAFSVELVYVEKGQGPSASGSGTFHAELPRLDVPTTYVGWTIYAPNEAKIKKNSLDGSLRDVEYLSMPLGAPQVLEIQSYNQNVAQDARQQIADGAMGQGAAPVPVRLPLEGQALAFEKVLALDESLWVEFDYKGLD